MPKPTATWKSRERQIAARFGSKRTPLSGGNSGHSRSDSLHKSLFIEAKHRKKHTVISLWEATKILAEKESKVPVIALTQHGKQGFWIMCHVDDLQRVAEEERLASERDRAMMRDPTVDRRVALDNRIVRDQSELA